MLLLIPLLVGLSGCAESRADATSAQEPAIPVSAITAAPQQWPAIYETTGTVRAKSSAVISAKWMGYVREVKVNAGDHVRDGQLLVTLDARDLDASSSRAEAAREEVRNAVPEAESAVAAARANLEFAEATFRRMNELYSKKSISDHEFDEASARRKAAQSALEMAQAKRAQLNARLAQADEDLRSAQVARSYAEIHAPFTGVVTAKSVDPGNLATPGAPLLTIEREGYRLEASVEESKLGVIRVGQTASITLDGIGRGFEARVSEVVPSVDAASRSYIAKLDLPATPELRSGQFGRAAFHVGERPVIVAPEGSVIERGQLQSVYVTEGGVARTRLVTLGSKQGDQVEVLSGLNAGERIIFPVPSVLVDGARVEVKP